MTVRHRSQTWETRNNSWLVKLRCEQGRAPETKWDVEVQFFSRKTNAFRTDSDVPTTSHAKLSSISADWDTAVKDGRKVIEVLAKVLAAGEDNADPFEQP